MRARVLIVALLLALSAAPAAAAGQDPPDEAIERGVGAFAATVRRGSVAEVRRRIQDCWDQLARAPRDLQGAFYCAALNFAAEAFDKRAAATFGAGPEVSLDDARVNARRALSAAGISPTSAAGIIEVIRERSIAATARHF
ncbi:hypothetical protein [Methylobacterium sp. A54F]